MDLTLVDAVAFIGFLAIVVAVSLYASRGERTDVDYFLAGRGLTWSLVGFSLIASNISTEHFVGMAGAGFGEAGLAIASYEWIAAVVLVVVALVMLPAFLKLGVFTMPEFLERRFNGFARTVMATYMMIAYVGVAIAAVLYSGAIGLEAIFGLDLYAGIWLIGAIAGVYTVYGGLKAVVWSDLLQGAALLIGGAFVAVVALGEVGGLSAFLDASADKLHVVLPAEHSEIPWTALIVGIWIPNFFYWGCNQFITQRTLGAKNLAQGQKGALLAAGIKLIIPFIIVFPGIMALQLYGNQIADGDQAYPILIKNLVPVGLRGVMFAALFGAVMSSLDSMLNSASTIFTMDLFRRHIKPDVDDKSLVKIGRIATGAFVVVGCLLAPLPGEFEGVFQYIQMIWGFISPGVVAAFLFGFVVRRAPANAAVVALFLSPIVYGALLFFAPEVAFLNHMAITFGAIVATMTVMTILNPRETPALDEDPPDFDMTPAPSAKYAGAAVLVGVVALYIVFW
jgi:solute:Na+ symporter, SSS family